MNERGRCDDLGLRAGSLVCVILFPGGSPPDVDAVPFARAFRAGKADQFRNQQVRGSGVSFHGAVTERIADGTTRSSLVITLGADRDNAPVLVKTWDEFVAAERARTTLVVALSGAALPVPSGTTPQTYVFAGVYDGQVRTIMRVPQASDSIGTPLTAAHVQSANESPAVMQWQRGSLPRSTPGVKRSRLIGETVRIGELVN